MVDLVHLVFRRNSIVRRQRWTHSVSLSLDCANGSAWISSKSTRKIIDRKSKTNDKIKWFVILIEKKLIIAWNSFSFRTKYIRDKLKSSPTGEKHQADQGIYTVRRQQSSTAPIKLKRTSHPASVSVFFKSFFKWTRTMNMFAFSNRMETFRLMMWYQRNAQNLMNLIKNESLNNYLGIHCLLWCICTTNRRDRSIWNVWIRSNLNGCDCSCFVLLCISLNYWLRSEWYRLLERHCVRDDDISITFLLNCLIIFFWNWATICSNERASSRTNEMNKQTNEYENKVNEMKILKFSFEVFQCVAQTSHQCYPLTVIHWIKVARITRKAWLSWRHSITTRPSGMYCTD